MEKRYPLPEEKEPVASEEIAIYNVKGDPELEEILQYFIENPQDKRFCLKMIKGKKEIKEAVEGFVSKNLIIKEKKQMKKGMSYFLGLLLLFGCATAEQRQQATEGITFETNKPRDKAIDAIVQILTEEGYSIDTINEKYGIINCKPYKILSGELMKKLGEPGGGFVATKQHLIHYIEFSAVISEQGTIKLKATASSEEMALDVFRTEKMQNYFAQKIKERVSK